jgi:hypothetical protein
MSSRPAVQRGIAVPTPPVQSDDPKTAEEMVKSARSMLQT